MTIEELKGQLELLPKQFESALAEQTEAILEYEELTHKLTKLEKMALMDNDDVENDDENNDIELIQIETGLEKLKLRLAETEDREELEVRKSNERITESYVKALVGLNETVSNLRNELIEAKANFKIKKAERLREKREHWEKEKRNRFQNRLEPENEELKTLQADVLSAKKRKLLADDSVEVLRIRLKVFISLLGFEDSE